MKRWIYFAPYTISPPTTVYRTLVANNFDCGAA